MRLLQFVQTVNNTLGAVETGRSLVTTRQGAVGNGSVSALSQQINNVGAELTSEIRGARDVLQQDIRTVNTMVSQVQAQQALLRQEIQQVIEGVSGLNALMKKHMTAVEDQLRFIIDEPLQNACYQLTAHLTNNDGIAATDDEIRAWLRPLQTWIGKVSTRKTATLSSEDAVRMFAQSPDNIGLMISRLHLLFGDIIPAKFLLLPFVSLKFYFLVIKLYLNTLEKNPHLLSSDKAQTICQEIQNTLKIYLEFSDFIKQHPEIIQALFDQYHYYKNKNASISNELRELLKTVVVMIGDAKFTAQLSQLESTQNRQLISVNPTMDIWDHLPKTLPEHERVKRLLAFFSQENAPTVGRTKYMILPEEMPYEPIPHMLTVLKNRVPQPSPYGNRAEDNAKYMTCIVKPAAFYTTSMLLLCLMSGYAEISFFQSSTLKKHVMDASPNNAQRPENLSQGNYYTTDIRVLYERLSDKLPTEYDAILKSAADKNGILNLDELKNAFRYFKLMTNGNLLAAKSFAQTNPVDHYCLLFLTAIAGRFDIFKNYIKQYPLPVGFNYAQTAEDGTLNLLMFAAQNGHADVVNALLKIYVDAWQSQYKEHLNSVLTKAAQLATAQGFTDIADMIKRAQRGVLPGVTTRPAVPSDYENGLEEMRSSVSVTKTKLGEYIPVPPPAQQAAPSAQVADPLPDEVTDDEMEEELKEKTRQFFTEANMHAGKSTFWSKPSERRYHRTGFRVMENTDFKDADQRRLFSRRLQRLEFTVSVAEELESKLLVKLGTKTPKA